MVYRVFVEKKAGLDNEARSLLNEAKNLLGIEALENVRLFNRYDAENITEELFGYAVSTVFSEPQLDTASETVELPGAVVFAVEPLPGQFDQRADSAAQCIQILSQGDRPTIRSAKVYALYGELTDADGVALGDGKGRGEHQGEDGDDGNDALHRCSSCFLGIFPRSVWKVREAS